MERQWHPVFAIGPYVLLAVLVAYTMITKWADGASLLLDLLLCGLAAVSMLLARLKPVFFWALLGIMLVLVIRDPWFGCLTPAGFIYAFRVLRWPWELVGVAAVAVIAGTAQATAVDKSTLFGLLSYIGVLAANVGPMCLFAWFLQRGAKHEEERERTMLELSEANRRLEATLAVNADLHERLLSQAREAGVLDERQRMAREIHDTLAQGLIGIIAQLQAAEQATDDPAAWQRHLSLATGLARESLSEARRSVHALRPAPLETGRLADALSGVAGRWSALHGLEVALTTTGTPRPMPPEVEVALLRTAQEALANVAKHAQAGRVGVTLSYMEDSVALDVRDDGKGFDPADGSSGFGLIAMRQRVEGLSGTLQIESEPGAGTGISASVPAEALL
ncbi:sensor histidine kinase [Nonomuraea sediminis]|uniref:sensor histidine kinase n=1 Tax=Nonomuraea sediminis TaxID=2835864 RepID=UPI002029BE73|nr:sensor histidine kinase [Nonomuraea sediminis]